MSTFAEKFNTLCDVIESGLLSKDGEDAAKKVLTELCMDGAGMPALTTYCVHRGHIVYYPLSCACPVCLKP